MDPQALDRAKRHATSADVVRAATLWLAAGALFKLFTGSPNDLPEVVHEVIDRIGLDINEGFRVAIALELCIVTLGLFRPRFGWIPLALIYVVFDVVLAMTIQRGAKSCGCFGGAIDISPEVMISVDSVLLLGVLLTRPWSALARTPLRPLLLLPFFGASIVAPWYLYETPPIAPLEPRAEPVSAEPAAPARTPEDGATPAPGVADEGGAEARRLPDFVNFDISTWVGTDFFETDLAALLGEEAAYSVLDPAQVILYRRQCTHCKEHFEKMAADPASLDRPLILIRVPEPGDTPENEVTLVKPPHEVALELPELERGYGGLTTPVVLELRDFRITKVEELGEDEDEEDEDR